MSYAAFFSPDYLTARSRFRTAAKSQGFRLESHSIHQSAPNGEDLTIDVAILEAMRSEKLAIVSSGLHGVEGFFGSAVQLALLERHPGAGASLLKASIPPHTSLILIHALNPYGFAWHRRWNEENIDLNRNFLLPSQTYTGSPTRYPDLNAFLNPTSPPQRFEPFLAKAIAQILRYGTNVLKDTIPVGQYDFPKGLFFGGHAPSKTQQILAANLPRWVGNTGEILHIDFHTGLGRKATYQLFTEDSSENARALGQKLDPDAIESYNLKNAAYTVRGGLGRWCRDVFPDRHYNFFLAEFGTYATIQVVKALRAENRAHWFGQPDDDSYQRAKQQLVEVFVPADLEWREAVVFQGLQLVERAIEAVGGAI